MPSHVLSYIQMGQFLMLVMTVSWFFSVFYFQSLCAIIGPQGDMGSLNFKRLLQCLRNKKCSSPQVSSPPCAELQNIDDNDAEFDNEDDKGTEFGDLDDSSERIAEVNGSMQELENVKTKHGFLNRNFDNFNKTTVV